MVSLSRYGSETSGDPADRGGRRLLLTAGTGPGRADGDDEGRRLVELFVTAFGYHHLAAIDLRQGQDRVRDALRGFAEAADRRPDDRVVVYLAVRGCLADAGELALLPLEPAADDADGYHRDPVTTRQFLGWLATGTPVRQMALIVDLRGTGQDALVAAGADIPRWLPDTSGGPAVVVVLASGTAGEPTAAAFPSAFLRAVRHPASGGHCQPDLRIETLVRVMTAESGTPGVIYRLLGAADEPAGFLPNPRHQEPLVALDLYQEDRLSRGPEASRAEPAAARASCPIEGRRRALAELARWLNSGYSADTARTRVVTGGPGSGKTAVLRFLAALGDADRRAGMPAELAVAAGCGIDVDIDAGGRTTGEVLSEIAAAAQASAAGAGDLLRHLAHREDPLTVLVDAVDEAADPAELVRCLIRPLGGPHDARLRLLVGIRSDLRPLLGDGPVVIDLDAAPFADPGGMRGYVRGLLTAHPGGPYQAANRLVLQRTADAIAGAAGTSYLVAGIAARTTAALETPPDPVNQQWLRALPRTVCDAMRQDLEYRLGTRAQRARELLLPLAYAGGAGLPWEDLWARLANALSPGRRYGNDDLAWLCEAAGAYVLESGSAGRSVYRLRYRALAECLRAGRDGGQDHRTIVDVLTERVPLDAGGRRDWARAEPYARAHLASHAAAGERVDDLLTDASFLLAARPAQVLAALPAARSDAGRTAAHAYRRAAGSMGTKPTGERAAYLELAARCGHAPALADAIAGAGLSRPWSVRWTSWESPPSHRVCAGHTSGVLCVVSGQVGGRPVVVSGGDDATLRVWDLHSGTAVGAPLSGHSGAVTAVALGELAGRSVAVSGGDDATLRVWDLDAGTAIGAPLSGHSGTVTAVVLGDLAGHPVAVSGGDDRSVRVWDLATGRPLKAPLTGHGAGVTCLALGDLDGRAVAISGGRDRSLRVWDLASGAAVGGPVTGHAGAVTCVALEDIDGTAVAISGSEDGTIRTWNLVARVPVGKPLTGHTDAVLSVATGVLDGYPIAVSGGRDRSVRVWDLTTSRAVGDPLEGHASGVTCVAVGQLDGHPVAISASHDHTVGIWDSAIAGRRIGKPFTGHTDAVMSLACYELNGVPTVVSGSADHTLRAWDLATGHPIGRPYLGHAGGVWTIATGALNGRAVAVSGGADQRIRLWDLGSHQPVAEPFTGHAGWVWAVALTELDGRTVVVSGSDDHTLRIWDPMTGHPVGEPLTGHTSGVTCVAVGELDGVPIAVSGSHDHSLRIWNLATGHTVGPRLTGHAGGVWAVALGTLNEQRIAVSGSADRTVRIWDLATGAPVGSPLAGHADSVTCLAIGELDGDPVVVSGSDDRTVRVWDLRSRRPLGKPVSGHANGVRAVAIGTVDDSLVVVTGSHDRTIRAWNPRTGAPIEPADSEQTTEVWAVAVGTLNGSAVIASAGHTVDVRDLATGTRSGMLAAGPGEVRALALGELDRRPIAVCGHRDHTVRVWNLATGRPVGEPLTGHTGAVTSIALGMLDGRTVAVSGSDDHTVRVWDLATGAAVGHPMAGHADTVAAVATGVLNGYPVALSAGEDRTLRVWDLTTGRPIGEPLHGHTGALTCVAFGELDGHPVAVSGSRDRSVRIWALTSGRQHHWYQRRESPPSTVREWHFADPVSGLAFSTETDTLIATAGSALELRSLHDDTRTIELGSRTLAVATGTGLVGVGTESGTLVIDIDAGRIADPDSGGAAR